MKSNLRAESLVKVNLAAPQSSEPTAGRPLSSMLLSVIAAFSLAACGSTNLDLGEDDESDEEEAGGEVASEVDDPATDAIMTPPPNGTHITEAEACDALAAAQDAKKLELDCVLTTRACPALLRALTGAPCVEYDEGSVMGCIDLYKGASDCKDLAKTFSACVVTFYPYTKSKECK